jgi:hypothetical protein
MKAIDANKFYKPMEIVREGFITNTTGNGGRSAYNFILKLIRAKKLLANDVGVGKVSHFLVRGQDVLNFLNARQS